MYFFHDTVARAAHNCAANVTASYTAQRAWRTWQTLRITISTGLSYEIHAMK